MNIRVVDRNKNVNTYKCPKCDFTSTRYNNVMQHVAQVHEAVKYPCQYCRFTATEYGHLKKHMNICKGPKESVEQLYECCLCENLFISENHLKMHQNFEKEKCTKRGFSECHVCNKIFDS